MIRTTAWCGCAVAMVVTACGGGGGSGSGDGSASAEGSASLTSSAEGTAGSSDTSGSGGHSGTTTTATSADSSGGSSGETEGPKFDLGIQPDVGTGECNGKGGGLDFSYIWIANTAQGTITKLDTQTMVEAGRYITRPDSAGSPSRTSVNLSGDVAVGNRNGGVTKVYARPEDCVDGNGTPGLQTSTGKDDILAWGEEECVAWYVPMAYTTQRPVAWTAGTFDEDTCSYHDQKLWISGAMNTDAMNIDVVLINGDDGAIENMVTVPIAVNFYGAYGGAVDAEGDFWFMTYTSGSPLVEVDLDTLDYEITMMPAEVHPYGITVDHAGRVWFGADIGATARYDPATTTWMTIPGTTGLGIQEHPDGYMWMGTFPTTGIQAIDVETLALGPFIALPSPSQTKGVSIDFYGYVWLVDMTQTAWRIDPDTLAFESYDELDSPYTYSDMTGWGLSNVVGPQG
ncbi:MAG: hypothetical protein K1X88_12100 [Nannocystaceae bacterium]|nr:hypothetical protein [Nannocystaceae bacterium]